MDGIFRQNVEDDEEDSAAYHPRQTVFVETRYNAYIKVLLAFMKAF